MSNFKKPTAPFKVGDKGLTRSGRPYEIIAVNVAQLPDDDRVVAVVHQADNTRALLTFKDSGRYYNDEVSSGSAHDLQAPRRLRTVYLNVYEGDCYGYDTEERAIRAGDELRALKIAYPVEVEL